MPDKSEAQRRRRGRAAPAAWRALKVHLELYGDLVRKLAHESGPLVRGSVGVRWRRCGRPTCRCSRGELHPACYLSATRDGRQRQLHVPLEDERQLKRAVQRYRRFREGLRLLAELHAWHLRALTEFGEALEEPYPKDRPAPGKRGPRARVRRASRS